MPRVVHMKMEHIFGKEQPKRIFKVALDETKTKMISAEFAKMIRVVIYMLTRERVPPIIK